jgi:acyl-CoA thioester hydrolase
MVDANDAVPTLAEARGWPRTLAAAVEPGFIDAMGHMNVAWYVHLFDRATWACFEAVGIDEAYRGRAHAGMFAVEEHLRYLGELRAGDPLEVYTRVVEARPKTVRLYHAMVDPVRDRLAATADVVGVHIDLGTRRSAPFPADILARLRAAAPAPAERALDDAGAKRFAQAWVAAWNRRDIEAVLAHYAEDAVFVSPKAMAFLGKAEARGKGELRAYWQAASARIRSLHFALEEAAWSAADQTLTMVYVATIDEQARRAVEIVRFRGGLIVRGEALYGADVARP